MKSRTLYGGMACMLAFSGLLSLAEAAAGQMTAEQTTAEQEGAVFRDAVHQVAITPPAGFRFEEQSADFAVVRNERGASLTYVAQPLPESDTPATIFSLIVQAAERGLRTAAPGTVVESRKTEGHTRGRLRFESYRIVGTGPQGRAEAWVLFAVAKKDFITILIRFDAAHAADGAALLQAVSAP